MVISKRFLVLIMVSKAVIIKSAVLGTLPVSSTSFFMVPNPEDPEINANNNGDFPLYTYHLFSELFLDSNLQKQIEKEIEEDSKKAQMCIKKDEEVKTDETREQQNVEDKTVDKSSITQAKISNEIESSVEQKSIVLDKLKENQEHKKSHLNEQQDHMSSMHKSSKNKNQSSSSCDQNKAATFNSENIVPLKL